MTQHDRAITGHYVTVEGTRIYYDECGRGVPLVCIHTAGACSLEWYEFLPIMAGHGFRALAIDLPGHGKSFPVGWQPFRNMRDYAEFTWKITTAVCASDKPVITGSSLGGNMVTDIACHHSGGLRAAVILEGGAHHPMPVAADLFADLEDPHACPGWQSRMERGVLSGCFYPLAEGRSIAEFRWLHRYAPQQIQVGDLLAFGRHDVRDKLKDVRCPVLVFKGEADYFIPDEMLDEVVDGIPYGLAEKCVGRQMGHYPMTERPAALAEVLMDFFRRRGIVAV